MSDNSDNAREELCANCGKPKAIHWAANFADGMMISGAVLICPSGVYMPRHQPGTERTP